MHRRAVSMPVCLMLLAAGASAETLTGRVVGVTDGATITVLVARQTIKVRLVHIAAPESDQPWSLRSKQSLAEICFGREASFQTQGKDADRPTLATVSCEGINASREQIRLGMAWVSDRDVRPDSPLYAVQREARLDRRGLWSDPQPIPPWQWRAGNPDPARK